MKRMQKAFTLVEIMIVVAIIGILIAIAVPGFIKARTVSQGRACSENLSKIDGAKEQWALETNHGAGITVGLSDLYASDGTGYIKSEPYCPTGGVYAVNAIGADPTCDKEDTTNNLHMIPQAP